MGDLIFYSHQYNICCFLFSHEGVRHIYFVERVSRENWSLCMHLSTLSNLPQYSTRELSLVCLLSNNVSLINDWSAFFMSRRREGIVNSRQTGIKLLKPTVIDLALMAKSGSPNAGVNLFPFQWPADGDSTGCKINWIEVYKIMTLLFTWIITSGNSLWCSIGNVCHLLLQSSALVARKQVGDS